MVFCSVLNDLSVLVRKRRLSRHRSYFRAAGVSSKKPAMTASKAAATRAWAGAGGRGRAHVIVYCKKLFQNFSGLDDL